MDIFEEARKGNEKILQQWVTPINVNDKDILGCTALHYVSCRGYTQCVKHLLSVGAIVNCNENVKRTPLHMAAYAGRTNVVLVLLSAGAQVDVIDGFGDTPLCDAIMCNHLDTTQILLEAGANLDLVNREIHQHVQDCAVLINREIPQHVQNYAALIKLRPTIRSSCLTLVIHCKRLQIPRDIIRILVKLVWDSRFNVETWIK